MKNCAIEALWIFLFCCLDSKYLIIQGSKKLPSVYQSANVNGFVADCIGIGRWWKLTINANPATMHIPSRGRGLKLVISNRFWRRKLHEKIEYLSEILEKLVIKDAIKRGFRRRLISLYKNVVKIWRKEIFSCFSCTFSSLHNIGIFFFAPRLMGLLWNTFGSVGLSLAPSLKFDFLCRHTKTYETSTIHI